MPIVKKDWITKQDLERLSDCLFLFGDNLRHEGYGGQAAVMRDADNAIGVPIKKRPSMDDEAFFKEVANYTFMIEYYDNFFKELENDYLKKGTIVIIPSDGLGTGRAQLEKRAPSIAKHLNHWLIYLQQQYNVDPSEIEDAYVRLAQT